MYTLKEVTKMLNMTEHTIRYYTDKCLVPTVKRDKNNNRIFDDESIITQLVNAHTVTNATSLNILPL